MPAGERWATVSRSSPWQWPVVATVAFALGALLPEMPLRDAATLRPIADVALGVPPARLAMAPFCTALDALTRLGARQQVALIVGVLGLYAVCTMVPRLMVALRAEGYRRRRRFPQPHELLAWWSSPSWPGAPCARCVGNHAGSCASSASRSARSRVANASADPRLLRVRLEDGTIVRDGALAAGGTWALPLTGVAATTMGPAPRIRSRG